MLVLSGYQNPFEYVRRWARHGRILFTNIPMSREISVTVTSFKVELLMMVISSNMGAYIFHDGYYAVTFHLDIMSRAFPFFLFFLMSRAGHWCLRHLFSFL